MPGDTQASTTLQTLASAVAGSFYTVSIPMSRTALGGPTAAAGDGFDIRICNITVGSQTFSVVAAQLVWN